MKKILSIIMAVCMCLSVAVMLTACGHECTFKTEWTYSDIQHWHKCEGEDCSEVADRADHSYTLTNATEQRHTMSCVCGKTYDDQHSFGEWVVTVEPTKESAGTRVATCTTCAYEFSLPLQYEPKTTVDSPSVAIQNAIRAENYQIKFGENYNIAKQHSGNTYSYIGDTVYDGQYWTVEDSVIYRYRKSNGTWVKESDEYASNGYTARINFLANMLHFVDFSNNGFEYNASYKAYEASNVQFAIFSDVIGMETTGVKTYDKVRLYFEDDQLTSIVLELGNDSVSISIKYGTADFTVPTVE